MKAEPITKKELNTEDLILKAATTLFSRQGFNGTTTREIADLAGVNIAALHYHWGGKEDLLKAVYQKVIEQVSLLASRIFSAPVSGLKEALRTHLGSLHGFFVTNPEYPRILLYGDLENLPFVDKLRKETIFPIIREVSSQMRQLMSEGKIRKIDPEAALISFYGFLLSHFATESGQQACLGGTIAEDAIAKRLRDQFIEMVLLAFGL